MSFLWCKETKSWAFSCIWPCACSCFHSERYSRFFWSYPVLVDSTLCFKWRAWWDNLGLSLHLAISPQTLPRPNFPIHSLWESLGDTDQRYPVQWPWVSFKAAPKAYPNTAGMESIGSPPCVICMLILFSSHYCSNVTGLLINYPKCCLHLSNSRQVYLHISTANFFLPSSTVWVLLICTTIFNKWRHKVSCLFSVIRQLFLMY